MSMPLCKHYRVKGVEKCDECEKERAALATPPPAAPGAGDPETILDAFGRAIVAYNDKVAAKADTRWAWEELMRARGSVLDRLRAIPPSPLVPAAPPPIVCQVLTSSGPGEVELHLAGLEMPLSLTDAMRLSRGLNAAVEEMAGVEKAIELSRDADESEDYNPWELEFAARVPPPKPPVPAPLVWTKDRPETGKYYRAIQHENGRVHPGYEVVDMAEAARITPRILADANYHFVYAGPLPEAPPPLDPKGPGEPKGEPEPTPYLDQIGAKSIQLEANRIESAKTEKLRAQEGGKA